MNHYNYIRTKITHRRTSGCELDVSGVSVRPVSHLARVVSRVIAVHFPEVQLLSLVSCLLDQLRVLPLVPDPAPGP